MPSARNRQRPCRSSALARNESKRARWPRHHWHPSSHEEHRLRTQSVESVCGDKRDMTFWILLKDLQDASIELRKGSRWIGRGSRRQPWVQTWELTGDEHMRQLVKNMPRNAHTTTWLGWELSTNYASDVATSVMNFRQETIAKQNQIYWLYIYFPIC